MSTESKQRSGDTDKEKDEGGISGVPKSVQEKEIEMVVTQNGRVTIPHRIRWLFSIEEGDTVAFRVEDDGIYIRKVE